MGGEDDCNAFQCRGVEMPALTVNAYAKVNWHLAVGERRSDGYHPIASVFQRVSMHDVVTVSMQGYQSRTTITGLEDYVQAGHSTVDKAIFLWRKATLSKADVLVSIKKNIPVQSGLGGGSSNAAAVLLALNSLADVKLPFETLCRLGLEVGCDVPFFMYDCDAACVFGIGEDVHPITARHDLKGFVLIPYDEKVSTATAYNALDRRKSVPALDLEDSLVNEYAKPCGQWRFRNDFELVNKRPNLGLEEGERLLLTGSGSCWILLSDRDAIDCNGFSAVPVTF